MSSHAISFVLTITTADYASAERRRRGGDLSANPLTLALVTHTAFILTSYTPKFFTVRNIRTGQQYTGPVPALLEYFLSGFRRGRRVLEDHEFEVFLKTTASELPRPAATPLWEAQVKILLDRDGMSRLVLGWQTSDHILCFVANAPARAIVAFLNGLDPRTLTWSVVEAQSGERIGLDGQVRPGNVGQPHTEIIVGERVNGPPDMTLSQMLNNGKQEEA